MLVEHRISANPTNPFLDLDLLGDEVHWVDWNQDGLKDLLLSRAQCNGVQAEELLWDEPRKCYTHAKDGPAVRYFQGQEDGSLRQNLSAFEDVDAGENCRISVADWNGDGRLDLIVISWVNMSFYENQGGKAVLSHDFALSQIDGLAVRMPSAVDYLHESVVGVPSQPIAVDWDDDGLTDLILAPEGRFFRRHGTGETEKETSLIEVPAEENPFTALPTSAASDLQWRLMDCDGDGDLDLIRLNKSMQINACEREGDALKCSSNFECLEWASEYEKSGPRIYSFDLWREGNILSFLGKP